MWSSRLSLSTTLVAAFVVVAAPSAGASPIVDQSCCDFYGGFAVLGRVTRAQTFTVGIDGILSGVALDLLTVDAGAVTLEVYGAVTGGTALSTLGPALDSTTLAWTSSGSGYVFGSLTAGLEVARGDVLTIIQRPTTSTTSRVLWQITDFHDDHYGGGEAFQTRTSDLDTLQPAIFDAGFRTFVEPTRVPEPSVTTLFALGIALQYLGRRLQSHGRTDHPLRRPSNAAPK